MTDKVQKIRKKVEMVVNRRLNLLNGDYFDLNKETYGFTNEIIDIIDSLQKEPVSIDFEQELYKAFGQVKDFTLGMRIAKWFYDIGKKSREPVSEDLEDAAEDYGIRQGVELKPFAIKFFKAGAKWQKEQMMAKAINGYVIEDVEEGNGDFLLSADYLPKSMGLKDRQKVKVIVIKEE